VMLDVVFDATDGLSIARWVAVESPFVMDNVLVTVVETLNDRRREQSVSRNDYDTIRIPEDAAVYSAMPQQAQMTRSAPTAVDKESNGFADEYRETGVARINMVKGNNRVALPRLQTKDARLTYNAYFSTGLEDAASKQAFGRVEWKADEFVFSGDANVRLNGGDVQRVWYDAWKNPTRQWIDMPGGNKVIAYRAVHTQRRTQDGMEVIVRLEVYNRGEKNVDVVVRELFHNNEPASEEFDDVVQVLQFTGERASVQEMRRAAEDTRYIEPGVQPAKTGWTHVPVMRRGVWAQSRDPETCAMERNSWEFEFAGVAPGSGQMMLYKTAQK